MQDFTQHLFNVGNTARQAAEDARARLLRSLDNGEGYLGPALGEMFHLQAYARWWNAVTDHIEQHRMDAVTALTRARTSARQTLLDHPTPRTDCPFTYGQAIAFIEATRHFYRDSASLKPDPLSPSAGFPPPSRFDPPQITSSPQGTNATTPRRPM